MARCHFLLFFHWLTIDSLRLREEDIELKQLEERGSITQSIRNEMMDFRSTQSHLLSIIQRTQLKFVRHYFDIVKQHVD